MTQEARLDMLREDVLEVPTFDMKSPKESPTARNDGTSMTEKEMHYSLLHNITWMVKRIKSRLQSDRTRL